MIQTYVRKKLYEVQIGDDLEEEYEKLSSEWIDKGTEEWKDFASFVFQSDKIEILFPPYQVAAYAYGAQFVEIPYEEIIEFMRDEYISFLHIERLKY